MKRLRGLFGRVEEMGRAAAGITPYLFGGRAAGTEKRVEIPLDLEKRLEANRLLIEVERCFSLPDGIPNRNWFKHLIFGTRSTYAALLLPELTEAAEAGNDEGVGTAIDHLEQALEKVISKLKKVGGLIDRP
jgi:hypothetical protein